MKTMELRCADTSWSADLSVLCGGDTLTADDDWTVCKRCGCGWATAILQECQVLFDDPTYRERYAGETTSA